MILQLCHIPFFIELHQCGESGVQFFLLLRHFIIGIIVIRLNGGRIFVHQFLRLLDLLLEGLDFLLVLLQRFLIGIGCVGPVQEARIQRLLCGNLFLLPVQQGLSVIQIGLGCLFLQLSSGRFHAFVRQLQDRGSCFHLILTGQIDLFDHQLRIDVIQFKALLLHSNRGASSCRDHIRTEAQFHLRSAFPLLRPAPF